MSRALTHLSKRGLSNGWVSWSAAWRERVAKLASLQRGMSHMLNRQLSRGWGAWVEMAADRAEYMRLLRRGGSFMFNRKLAASMASWLAFIAPRDDPMARAVKHLVNRQLSRGWTGWHSRWQEVQRLS